MAWGQTPSGNQDQGSAPPNPSRPDAPPPWESVAPQWEAPRTPLGPAPGVEFAPHGPRLVAYLIDGFLIGMVMVAFTLVAIAALVSTASDLAVVVLLAFALFIGLFVISLGYFPWFWVHGGQTPGMRLFGLVVVRDRDGGPLSWGQAILRLIGYWVDGLVFYLGFIWILVDERRRGWHDLIAGTVVIAIPRR